MEFYGDELRQAVVARFRTSQILDEESIQSLGRDLLNAVSRAEQCGRMIVAIIHSLPETFAAADVIAGQQAQNPQLPVYRTLFELWDAGLLEQVDREGQVFYTKRLPD